ncbi:hypothetical protein JCM10207_000403 [Rhodosporidiobolus poonsookiae]
MSVLPVHSVEWPSKPRVLWLEGCSVGGNAGAWGLDLESRFAREIICIGKETDRPADCKSITLEKAKQLLQTDRKVVFLRPPTRVTAPNWPKLRSHDSWSAVIFEEEVERLALIEWEWRCGQGSPAAWSKAERKAARKRLVERESDCTYLHKLYVASMEEAEAAEEEAAELAAAKAAPITRLHLWVARLLYELSQKIELTSDGKKISTAAVSVEAVPGAGSSKAKGFFSFSKRDALLPPLLPPPTPTLFA